ncbi:MAG TPA: hypothetical protein VF807_07235, partial [Ktedonobacterales bacterium]
EERELARRSDLIAWMVLGLLLLDLAVIGIQLDDPASRLAMLVFAAGMFPVLWLNRKGFICLAGTLLSLLVSGVIFGAVIFSPNGLTLGKLPDYDIMVVGVFVAAAALPRGWTFFIAGVNCVAIVLDYLLQPHNRNLIDNTALYTSPHEQAVALLIRPIALHVTFAVMAYLLLRSLDLAHRQADRVEEIAKMESDLVSRSNELAVGLRMIRQVLVRVEEGNLTERVPDLRIPLLAKVGMSINSLIDYRAQHDSTPERLRLTEQAAIRVAEVLDDWRHGINSLPPAPNGTTIDAIISKVDPYYAEEGNA